MTSSRQIFVAAALVLLLFSRPARAQRTAQDIESARQLYNQGIDLRDKGDLKGALEKLKAAHALGNTPLTGIELCRTYAALRQPVEAREVCLGVGRIPPLAQETSRSQEARNEAARIAEAEKPKIGSVRLKIVGVPAGWEPMVTVDNTPVPAVALSEPRAVNPGVHTIVAKVGSGVETRATLQTKEGESRDLEMAVQPPPAGETPSPHDSGPSPSPAPVTPPEKKNTFATVTFAVAGALGVLGTVAGIVAISGESDLKTKCAAKICGRADWDALSSAQTWGNVSTVSFILGGGALGAGLVSILIASNAKKSGALHPAPRALTITPVVGLFAGGVHGSF
jgi:hypothetical protein